MPAGTRQVKGVGKEGALSRPGVYNLQVHRLSVAGMGEIWQGKERTGEFRSQSFHLKD